MPTHIAVIGASFAGLSAALELRRLLPDHAQIRISVISQSPDFVYLPSLIWIAVGDRQPEEISFPLAPVLASKSIEFRHATVTSIDPNARTIQAGSETISYDYLILAVGASPDFASVPGFDAGVTAHSLTSLADALALRESYRRLLDSPGPAVIGLAPDASLFGVAYEFVLNLAQDVAARSLVDRIPITFVTPEPHLGHFGMGCGTSTQGSLQAIFDAAHVRVITNAAITQVSPGSVHLAFQETLASDFSLILPAYRGSTLLRNSGLADSTGLVPVDGRGQHTGFLNIYAAGSCVAVRAPWKTPIAVGVNKTALPAEEMAFIAAHNIAAEIEGRPSLEYPRYETFPAFLLLDAGESGVLVATDKMVPPRSSEFVIPSHTARWAKIAYEKYYLWKMRHGFISLP